MHNPPVVVIIARRSKAGELSWIVSDDGGEFTDLACTAEELAELVAAYRVNHYRNAVIERIDLCPN